jgi:hypothetical protein
MNDAHSAFSSLRGEGWRLFHSTTKEIKIIFFIVVTVFSKGNTFWCSANSIYFENCWHQEHEFHIKNSSLIGVKDRMQKTQVGKHRVDRKLSNFSVSLFRRSVIGVMIYIVLMILHMCLLWLYTWVEHESTRTVIVTFWENLCQGWVIFVDFTCVFRSLDSLLSVTHLATEVSLFNLLLGKYLQLPWYLHSTKEICPLLYFLI